MLRNTFGMVVLVLGLLATGCSSTAPEASGAAVTMGPQGQECVAIPTMSSDDDQAGLAPLADPVLESKFPTAIDGQPVSDLQSAHWFAAICLFGGQTAVDDLRTMVPNPDAVVAMTVAAASATVDGETVKLAAYRTPDLDAHLIVDNLAVVAQALGTSARFVASPAPMVVGGRDVLAWAQPDGSTTYVYVNGDTFFLVDSVSPSQAAKIFAALP